MNRSRLYALAVPLALLSAAPLAAQDSEGDKATAMLQRMLSGRSELEGEALEKAIALAETHPLGSQENPVRVGGPAGQRGYLARLRCANLKQPVFKRIGSMGLSPYGNIVDGYALKCEGSEPAERTIYMDMYHPGHVEDRAVEGYGIAGGRRE